jgi:transposase
MKREQNADGSVTETKTMTFTEKKTYTQDWPNYDRAQREEKHRLQVLLAELCRSLPEPEFGASKPGTKRVPMPDRAFAVCYKVYCGMSQRRSGCDMSDATKAGYLSRPIHPSKVSAFFCEPELTAILQQLIVQSALPLRAIETDFAVDSTGFSVSKFIRWHDEKWGVERSGHDWVKAHICTGVRTNVITAAVIKGREAGDSPIMPEMVKTTAEHFTINEMSADSAYLSVANVETVAACGGTPFILPKSNTTGGVGGLFERMFHFYQYRREEFMDKYHKRSNVESTFSAVKRLFGDSVRAKHPVAMVNEVLAKFVCFNLTCVIHSQLELGVEAEFWNDKQEETRCQILKFPG